jgi:hypothetical protein
MTHSRTRLQVQRRSGWCVLCRGATSAAWQQMLDTSVRAAGERALRSRQQACRSVKQRLVQAGCRQRCTHSRPSKHADQPMWSLTMPPTQHGSCATALCQERTWAAQGVVEVRVQQHGLRAGRGRLGRDGYHHVADIMVRICNVLVDEHHVDGSTSCLPVHLNRYTSHVSMQHRVNVLLMADRKCCSALLSWRSRNSPGRPNQDAALLQASAVSLPHCTRMTRPLHCRAW